MNIRRCRAPWTATGGAAVRDAAPPTINPVSPTRLIILCYPTRMTFLSSRTCAEDTRQTPSEKFLESLTHNLRAGRAGKPIRCRSIPANRGVLRFVSGILFHPSCILLGASRASPICCSAFSNARGLQRFFDEPSASGVLAPTPVSPV